MDDPNKLHHLFGDSKHNLDVLVREFGSEEVAGSAIIETVNQAYLQGGLVVDRRGRYQQVFDIGGYPVTVRGRIVSGIARVGSAWIRQSAKEEDHV